MDDQPTEDLDMKWFTESFNTLNLSRGSHGYGPIHITLTDIVTLLNIREPILDKFATIKILQLMDSAYLNDYVEKQTAKKEGSK